MKTSSISYIFGSRHMQKMVSKMGVRSATNSTTTLNVAVPKANAFEGFEHSLLTFKVMLLTLLVVDIFFLGLFIPSVKDGRSAFSEALTAPYTSLTQEHADYTSLNFFILYGYLALLLLGIFGILFNSTKLLAPLNVVWFFTLLMSLLVLLWTSWEYLFCSWSIYVRPVKIEKVCHWTFIDSYFDTAVYTIILGLKLSQVFLAHIVIHLLYKAIRIQSFDARKHGTESDDEDVMVVFEKMAGGSQSGKVRDATIA